MGAPLYRPRGLVAAGAQLQWRRSPRQNRPMTVTTEPTGAGLAVPELSPEARELKARAARFVEERIHPVEALIAERGTIDQEEIAALKADARAAGFANLNMPEA